MSFARVVKIALLQSRHAEQFNGREGETAAFLSTRLLNAELHDGDVAPNISIVMCFGVLET